MAKSILIIEGEHEDIIALRRQLCQPTAIPTRNVIWTEGRPNPHTPMIADGFRHAKSLLDKAFYRRPKV